MGTQLEDISSMLAATVVVFELLTEEIYHATESRISALLFTS